MFIRHVLDEMCPMRQTAASTIIDFINELKK
jgi:hypothetical protein